MESNSCLEATFTATRWIRNPARRQPTREDACQIRNAKGDCRDVSGGFPRLLEASGIDDAQMRLLAVDADSACQGGLQEGALRINRRSETGYGHGQVESEIGKCLDQRLQVGQYRPPVGAFTYFAVPQAGRAQLDVPGAALLGFCDQRR